jgi:hypothetical protein
MNPRQLRVGEVTALGGSICAIVSLVVPWYDSPAGKLDAWETFGPATALLLAAISASLAMVVSSLTERSPSLPVAIVVWCVPVSLAAVIAAVVRIIERPDHASGLAAGPWLALVGAAGMLVGAWLAMRDERPALYEAARPAPRPRP